VVVAVLIVLGLFGFGFRNYGMMGGNNNGFVSFGGIFGILMAVLVIAGIYWLIKNANHN
jgi:heme/copper-type cytochrome/quinol oxidase subunit 4